MLENFIMVVQQVLVLFVLIAVGFLCGKKRVITESSAKHITDIVLYVVTPCVMVSSFQREFSFELLENLGIMAVCSTLVIAASIGIAHLVFRGKDESRRKVLRFATVFSNCGFMSLPLQKAILGDDGLFYGAVFVAIFNIIVWTYGLASMSGDIKQLSIKKLAFNPGIIGVLIALIIFISGIKLPYIISKPVEYLASLNTPVPMLIIGFYLSQANLKKAFADPWAYVSMALRLIAIPLAAALIMALFKVDSTILVACVIASSASTAAMTTMFSAKYDRDVQLSVSIVAATTLLSVATMPLIIAFAQTIA